MAVAVACPGSFDPITLGHLDVIERAAARFDTVVVAVLENPGKRGLFNVEERLELIRMETAGLANVEVDRFTGLLVDFCRDRGLATVCKGVRGMSDVESELRMAQMNRRMSGLETMFLPTSPEHGHLSSSLVKEVARFGGPLDGAVSPAVEAALRAKLGPGTRPSGGNVAR